MTDSSSLYVERLPSSLDAVTCAARLRDLPHLLFLDSAAQGPRLGRYSFVTADPVAVIRSRRGQTECVDRLKGTTGRVAGDLLDAVRARLAPHTFPPVPGLPPFQGGAAGYLAYEWAHTLERVPYAPLDDELVDDASVGIYDWVLAWDHLSGDGWLISTGLPERSPAARARRAAARAADVRARLAHDPPAVLAPDVISESRGVSATAPHVVEPGWWDRRRLDLRSSFTRDGYLAAVARAREYVYAGDVFQLNLSQRFEAPLDEPPWTFYQRLRRRNAAPFGAYLALDDGAVLSISPERFLRLDADGRVETRPIKGTRPRGRTADDDAALRRALAGSVKDRAENLMIVDLMRNDLSRVCRPKSVRAPELFALETHASVHHLVSTVVGDLEPGADAGDLLRATFAAGSITGAPKVRAMALIAEMEPTARGVYCGAIGYWSVTGALDMSVAIRTAVARDGRLSFGAGGGIVADSEPEAEYQETLDKARGIIDALVC